MLPTQASIRTKRTNLSILSNQSNQVVLPEPVEFQYRVKPDWDEKHPWTDWEKCKPESASDYLKNPTLHNWTYEVRKLFTEQQVRALLATGGQAQAVDIAELVTGMSVSVDVSTCDDDAGNRYFGTVTVAQEDPHDKHGLTLLVQDAKPNFAPQAQADARDAESDYQRGYRHGYNRRDAEVQGALL